MKSRGNLDGVRHFAHGLNKHAILFDALCKKSAPSS